MNPMDKKQSNGIYDIALKSIDNENIHLMDFKGKKILFVNVASKCGFTPQYAELQSLSDLYKEELVVIGLPCNQFGNQEPGKAEEIQSFCQKNYGVTFLITEKIEVKGENQHALYQWLTNKSANGKMDSKVKWNFQKYLVSENGELIDMFGSAVSPLDEKITANFSSKKK
ncbi:glutathione peroxidase [Putridiphycobacter roseus]|nr:glutathione peroxidase [Putridiphycobacter roseus]